MRFVFLGSPPFATPVLERLLRSRFRPELVVTPPDRRRGRGRKVEPSEVALIARHEGIELHQPPSAKDTALVERLRALQADLFLVVSYGELLREEFLALPREVCLNVHPSLLPRHRGATPIPAAILAGDEETGVSIQKMVLELDAGDVLVQKRARVLPGETAGELAQRLAELSGEACLEALEQVAAGTAVYRPQDPAQVTVCKRLKKEHGLIDWSHSALELERHVRAMNPWPMARTELPGSGPLNVCRAALAGDPAAGRVAKPGELLQARERFLVACGEGALELLEVQAAGKRPVEGVAFLRGARLEQGLVLGG
jgi:methionyl-tRNA formyltransferase